jgi:hypothetical protein
MLEEKYKHRLESEVYKHLELFNGSICYFQVDDGSKDIDEIWVRRFLSTNLLRKLRTYHK